jgi:hypothetical protein
MATRGLPYPVSLKSGRIPKSRIVPNIETILGFSPRPSLRGSTQPKCQTSHLSSQPQRRPHVPRAAHTGDPKERNEGTPHCGMAVAASAEPQLVGIAVATVLAAIFLAAVLGRRRRRPAPVVEGKPVPVADHAVAGDEPLAGDDGTDVIIVGAGVAGSALAYTLGKVPSFVPSLFGWQASSGSLRHLRLNSVAFFP